MEITPDIFNGLFEFIGGCFLCLNLKNLYRDKEVKGVSWLPVVFMSSWGVWNLYYYPSLNQWWSFWGGLWIVSINTTWLAMIYYYYRKKKKQSHLTRDEAEWREAVDASEEAMEKRLSDKEWDKVAKRIKRAQRNWGKPTPIRRGGLINHRLSRRVLR